MKSVIRLLTTPKKIIIFYDVVLYCSIQINMIKWNNSKRKLLKKYLSLLSLIKKSLHNNQLFM